MKKNKKTLLIVLALLLSLALLIFPTYFLIKRTIVIAGNMVKNTKGITNTAEVEQKVALIQNMGYASSFSTEEGSKTKNLTHIKIWPTINLNHIDKITEFTVKNIRVTGYKKGKVAIIKPSHISGSLGSYNYLFGPMDEIIRSEDIKDSGRTLTYTVVDNPTYFDEVAARGTSLPYFYIILKELGEFNYTSIMEKTGYFYSSKVLEYAGVTADDINLDISFDVEMIFEDGTKYVKRFTGKLDGTTMLKNDGQNIEFTY